MTGHLTEDDVVNAIADLTPDRLVAFVQAELVIPLQTDRGRRFRQVDKARLELLCDLTEQFGMDEDALAVILSLIDQLYAVRSDLRCVLKAVDQQPEDVRARLEQAIETVQQTR